MADPVDVTRDASRMPIAPIDPNVRIPDAIRQQQLRAEQMHQQAYATQPEPQPAPAPAPVAPEPVTATVTPQPAEPVADPEAPPADGQPVNWEHRYKSMKGRYENLNKTVAGMQETMAQLGDTLIQMQSPQAPAPKPHNLEPAKPLVTEKDREAYGDELIDLASRIAKQTVAPELDALRAENNRLTKQVANKAQRDFFTQLDDGLPEWRQINTDKAFLNWLRLPDFYSGRVRQLLLNEAFQAANAAWAIRFFKGFQQEAAGSSGVTPTPQPQPAATAPAREAATSLEALAAPGRPKPAGSTTLPDADDGKPVITRAQIAAFYANVRKGMYAPEEKARLEAMVFAAQREGRVRG